MLVYVQKSQWDKLVYPFQDKDVPQELVEACEREVREQERVKKEKQEGVCLGSVAACSVAELKWLISHAHARRAEAVPHSRRLGTGIVVRGQAGNETTKTYSSRQ